MNIEHMERIKQLRSLIPTVEDESERVAYLIQLETLLPKPTKKLYIDADGLIYKAAYSPLITDTQEPIEGGFVGEVSLKDIFDTVVQTVVDACKYESLMGKMNTFTDYVLVYTPETNFRYNIYPKYKYKRQFKKSSDELTELKSIVKPLGLIVDGVEADDVVAHFGRRGNPIASGDKDVIYGVPGNNYFYHKDHQRVYKVTKHDAEQFVLLQTLAGDSVDEIPGIPGVGMKTKLMPDNANFNEIVSIYQSKGLTREDAILTRRLVGMDQWKGFRRGLKLFK